MRNNIQHSIIRLFRNTKSYIGFKLDGNHSRWSNVVSKINLYIFHYKLRYQKKCYGPHNPDKTFYVIRPTSEAEGLLSLFFTVIRNIEFAERNNMIPVVDFQNFKTQYNKEEFVNGSANAWEYYFKPISNYSLEEVYKSKNVYMFGWGRPQLKDGTFQNDYNEALNKKRHTFINKYTGVSKSVQDQVSSYKHLFEYNNVLGVFLRGTDYLRLKPAGHPIQPDTRDVINKAHEFIDKYDINKIFIVTEDRSLYNMFRDEFGNMLFSIDNNYISNYQEGYVYSCMANMDPYQKGLTYLTKMLLLNECDYLVSTLTNGSLFSLAMKEGDFKDKYIFNLGKY